MATLKERTQAQAVKTKGAALDAYVAVKDVVEQQTKQASRRLTKAQKQLRKTQKNLQKQLGSTWGNVQDTLQERMETTRAKTQRVLGKGKKQASKNLAKATANLQGMKESKQEQYKRRMRRQRRGPSLFLPGIIIGVVAAFLFTPIPGIQMRKVIATVWNEYAPGLGITMQLPVPNTDM